MPDSVVDRLNGIVAERSLLSHPFYQSWTRGTLPREALRLYAAQYYRYVAVFPTFVSGVHSSTEDEETRQELLENLIEEERGDRNHPELWLRFCEALGVQRDVARSASPLPELTRLVDVFRRHTREGTTSEGLATLYVYESQVPAVAAAKIEGLTRHYGVLSHDAISFFLVHLELDRWHSQSCARLLERSAASGGDRAKAIEAGRLATEALWSFLDGVHREAC